MEEKKYTKKGLKKRAKEILENMEHIKVDAYNWKIRQDLPYEDVIRAMKIMFNFITIPTTVLNEEETALFTEDLFEQIKVSN